MRGVDRAVARVATEWYPSRVSEDDPRVTELLTIIEQLHGGERAPARERFAALWERVQGLDPVVECVLCHYMADAQDDPSEELLWDERALERAMAGHDGRGGWKEPPTDPRLAALPLEGFLPSLYLNLAADHEKLGALDRARGHVHEAQRWVDALPTTDLGALTRQAIERLARRVAVDARARDGLGSDATD